MKKILSTLILLSGAQTLFTHNCCFWSFYLEEATPIEYEIKKIDDEFKQLESLFSLHTKKTFTKKQIKIDIYKNSKNNSLGIKINIPDKFNKEDIKVDIDKNNMLSILASKNINKINSDNKKDKSSKTYLYQEITTKKSCLYSRKINLNPYLNKENIDLKTKNSEQLIKISKISFDDKKNITKVTLKIDQENSKPKPKNNTLINNNLTEELDLQLK